MARPKRAAERVAAIRKAVAEYPTRRDAAHALGIDPAVVTRVMQEPQESESGSGDRLEITKTTGERVRTLADLIRVCEIDPVEWVVDRWVCNKWDSAAKVGPESSKRIAVTEMYQIKAWLRRNVALVAAKDELAALIADAKQLIRTPAILKRLSKSHSGNCAEVSVFDAHFGKLAWAPESGAHYDSRIAGDLFRAAVLKLLERVAPYKPERICLPIGNDLLHYDTKGSTTTAGTHLDTDGRYHKMFLGVRREMTWAINEARAIAPVDVLVVPGNHDTLGAFHLGDSLSCYFHTAKDVRIDNAPTMRKYYEWGAAMILFTHGDKGKRPNYPLLMAREQPEMWARTAYREAHTGHLHQTQVQEFHGVRVRILPSLCAADAWHSDNMFVGNMRAAEAFVWSKSEGLIGTAIYTAPDDLARKVA